LKKIFTFTLAAAFLLTPLYAHAWGREGHRITALVAQDHLTPAATAGVHALLGDDSMADVAPWADEYRVDHRETAPWHITNVPGSADKYDRNRDCPISPSDPSGKVRDCNVDRIPYFEGILRDPSATKDQKVFALKLLIHLMGDLHQPFHNMGDAKGGNQVLLNEFGQSTCGTKPCNLHSLWDDGLIEHRDLPEKKYVDTLEQEIAANNWQKLAETGSIEDWSNTGHHIAQHAWVDTGSVGEDYYKKWIPYVDMQLSLGGLRLADALNSIFTAPPSS